jgi:hypothetical protein
MTLSKQPDTNESKKNHSKRSYGCTKCSAMMSTAIMTKEGMALGKHILLLI